MKDYSSYSLQDFLQDDDFRDWVQGRSGRKESFWYTLSQRYPEKRATMDQAERIIRAVGIGNNSIDNREVRAEVEHFLEQIAGKKQLQSAENPGSMPLPLRSKWLLWAFAASMGLFGIFIHFQKNPEKAGPEGSFKAKRAGTNLVKTFNDTDKPLRILLEDSSEVVLSPNSCLSYPAHFSDTSRVVHLNGEANFSVRKGSRRFTVYAGEVVTKVLGTKFVVRAFEKDQNTTVQVLTGTVSVCRKEKNGSSKGIKEKRGLIITANQAAVFEKSLRQLTKTLVPDPAKLAETTGFETRRYDEVRLSEILLDLENVYGITILLDKDQFEKCRITATLSDENMYQKLDMLCKSIGATYQIVDGQILILGKGC